MLNHVKILTVSLLDNSTNDPVDVIVLLEPTRDILHYEDRLNKAGTANLLLWGDVFRKQTVSETNTVKSVLKAPLLSSYLFLRVIICDLKVKKIH